MVTREQIQGWLSRCDPYEPVGPNDSRERYCDLNATDEMARELRGGDPIAPLYDCVVLSGNTSCQLFSGFSGTGKSTELARLAEKLEGEGFAVLRADALSYHDLGCAITIEDLMVVIAAAFGDATQQLVGKEVFKETYWQRLREFLNTELSFDEVKIPAGGDLKLTVQHNQPFWLEAKRALASSPERLRQHCHGFVQRCVATVQQVRSVPSGVIFVFDSLEKLNPTEPLFVEIIASLVKLFTDFPGFLRLPNCHTLYTISPYARLIRPALRHHYKVSEVMPSVNAIRRGASLVPNPIGVQALRRLVGRRIPISEVFGERLDLLDQLIVYSGGHIRTLVVFLNELLYRAARHGIPQSIDDIEAIVQPTREEMQAALFRERLPLLATILRHESIDGIPEAQYHQLAALMEDNIVLCYRNHERWFAVHPLARARLTQLLSQNGVEATEKNRSD